MGSRLGSGVPLLICCKTSTKEGVLKWEWDPVHGTGFASSSSQNQKGGQKQANLQHGWLLELFNQPQEYQVQLCVTLGNAIR